MDEDNHGSKRPHKPHTTRGNGETPNKRARRDPRSPYQVQGPIFALVFNQPLSLTSGQLHESSQPHTDASLTGTDNTAEDERQSAGSKRFAIITKTITQQRTTSISQQRIIATPRRPDPSPRNAGRVQSAPRTATTHTATAPTDATTHTAIANSATRSFYALAHVVPQPASTQETSQFQKDQMKQPSSTAQETELTAAAQKKILYAMAKVKSLQTASVALPQSASAEDLTAFERPQYAMAQMKVKAAQQSGKAQGRPRSALSQVRPPSALSHARRQSASPQGRSQSASPQIRYQSPSPQTRYQSPSPQTRYQSPSPQTRYQSPSPQARPQSATPGTSQVRQSTDTLTNRSGSLLLIPANYTPLASAKPKTNWTVTATRTTVGQATPQSSPPNPWVCPPRKPAPTPHNPWVYTPPPDPVTPQSAPVRSTGKSPVTKVTLNDVRNQPYCSNYSNIPALRPLKPKSKSPDFNGNSVMDLSRHHRNKEPVDDAKAKGERFRDNLWRPVNVSSYFANLSPPQPERPRPSNVPGSDQHTFLQPRPRRNLPATLTSADVDNMETGSSRTEGYTRSLRPEVTITPIPLIKDCEPLSPTEFHFAPPIIWSDPERPSDHTSMFDNETATDMAIQCDSDEEVDTESTSTPMLPDFPPYSTVGLDSEQSTWSCTECWVLNDGNLSSCICCGIAKPSKAVTPPEDQDVGSVPHYSQPMRNPPRFYVPTDSYLDPGPSHYGFNNTMSPTFINEAIFNINNNNNHTVANNNIPLDASTNVNYANTTFPSFDPQNFFGDIADNGNKQKHPLNLNKKKRGISKPKKNKFNFNNEQLLFSLAEDINTWFCCECRVLNDIQRERCRRCKNTKLENSQRQRNMTLDIARDQTDPSRWVCSKCLSSNSRDDGWCVRCGAISRIPEPLVRTSDRRNPFDWTCRDCLQLNSENTLTCLCCGSCRERNPFEEPRWKCPQCRTINYGAVDLCTGCATNKLVALEALAGFGADMEGDDDLRAWNCATCTLLNSGLLQSCNCCGAEKGQVLTLEEEEPKINTEKKKVQWTCAKCDLLNPEERTVCACCGEDRPPADSWSCPQCWSKNSLDTVACMCCHSNRPGTLLGAEPPSGPTETIHTGWKCGICGETNLYEYTRCVTCAIRESQSFERRVQSMRSAATGPLCDLCGSRDGSCRKISAFSSVICNSKSTNVIIQNIDENEPITWYCSDCWTRNTEASTMCLHCANERLKRSLISKEPYNWMCFKCRKPYNEIDKNCTICGIKRRNKAKSAPDPNSGEETLKGAKKPNDDHWICEVCGGTNLEIASRCHCCEAHKPGTKFYVKEINDALRDPNISFDNVSDIDKELRRYNVAPARVRPAPFPDACRKRLSTGELGSGGDVPLANRCETPEPHEDREVASIFADDGLKEDTMQTDDSVHVPEFAFNFGTTAEPPVISFATTTTSATSFAATAFGTANAFKFPAATSTVTASTFSFGATTTSAPDSGFSLNAATTTAPAGTTASAFSVTTATTSIPVITFTVTTTETTAPAFSFPTKTASVTVPVPAFGFPVASASAVAPGFGFSAASTSATAPLPAFGFPTATTTAATPVPAFGFPAPATRATAAVPAFGFSSVTTSTIAPVATFGFATATTSAIASAPAFGFPTATTTAAAVVPAFAFPTASTSSSAAAPAFGFPAATTNAAAPVATFGFATAPANATAPIATFGFPTAATSATAPAPTFGFPTVTTSATAPAFGFPSACHGAPSSVFPFMGAAASTPSAFASMSVASEKKAGFNFTMNATPAAPAWSAAPTPFGNTPFEFGKKPEEKPAFAGWDMNIAPGQAKETGFAPTMFGSTPPQFLTNPSSGVFTFGSSFAPQQSPQQSPQQTPQMFGTPVQERTSPFAFGTPTANMAVSTPTFNFGSTRPMMPNPTPVQGMFNFGTPLASSTPPAPAGMQFNIGAGAAPPTANRKIRRATRRIVHR